MNYAQSGVNIEAGNRAVDLIKPSVKRTFTKHVLNSLGGFAAMVQVPVGYQEPVMVSCTDGVGTKLKIAIDLGKFDTLGIDLVAMCVNDLICCGAKPMFFLDYIACHALVPEHVKALIDGMVEGCLQSECALVGGEMAEMNDLYREGDFDLAGFSVGIVEKSKVIDGSRIESGNYVYGIPSAGLHSNGFSLVRKVLTPDVCRTRGISEEALLTPTRIYVKQVLDLVETKDIRGLAHITGGGLAENVARVLPKTVGITIEKQAWNVPAIFKHIQQIGQIEENEMFRVFNMGIGMVIISAQPLEGLLFLGRVESGHSGVVLVD